MSNDYHGQSAEEMKRNQEDNRIAREMMPYFLYAALPVLLIVFIALKWGPSY